MTQLKATPGPWTIRINGTLTGVWADIVQECQDPETGSDWDNELFRSSTIYVRRQDRYENTDWSDYEDAPEQYELTEDGEEHLANAHLIAAAPTMYEALDTLLSHYKIELADVLIGGEEEVAGADAALALARGEQS